MKLIAVIATSCLLSTGNTYAAAYKTDAFKYKPFKMNEYVIYTCYVAGGMVDKKNGEKYGDAFVRWIDMEDKQNRHLDLSSDAVMWAKEEYAIQGRSFFKNLWRNKCRMIMDRMLDSYK